jgi:hypothetical protein
MTHDLTCSSLYILESLYEFLFHPGNGAGWAFKDSNVAFGSI